MESPVSFGEWLRRRRKALDLTQEALAARDGGPDPGSNLALQNAIEKARENAMPKDNIERAIAKGSGTGADAAAYETVTYEGYGPGGVALFLEALTDNRNRTAADVRSAFTKNDGNLGESGSVAWLFERKGVILVDGSADEDELMLTAADAGAAAAGRAHQHGRCGAG